LRFSRLWAKLWHHIVSVTNQGVHECAEAIANHLILCVVFSALAGSVDCRSTIGRHNISRHAAGLKSLLQELADLAASDDHAKSSSAFHGLEIPDSSGWFASLLNADSAKQVAVAYAINPAGREDDFDQAARHG